MSQVGIKFSHTFYDEIENRALYWQQEQLVQDGNIYSRRMNLQVQGNNWGLHSQLLGQGSDNQGDQENEDQGMHTAAFASRPLLTNTGHYHLMYNYMDH